MPIRLPGVVVVGVVALLGLVASPAEAGAETATGWSVAQSFPREDFFDIGDIAATGPNDAWAVGGLCCDAGSGISRWDGTQWRSITPPAPPEGTVSAGFTNVGASSPEDAWVFGIGQDGLTFGQHWDGAAWSTTSFGQDVGIKDTAVVGPESAWFVGTRFTDTGEEPIAQHYDGQSWSETPLPTTAEKISAASDRDVWALGREEDGTLVTMRWTGSSWQTLPLPKPALHGDVFAVTGDILALGPDDVWASATLGKDEGIWPGSLLWHWNGRRWRKVGIDAPQDSPQRLASDGHGGLWIVSFNFTDLAYQFLHYSDGEVTREPVPLGEGTEANVNAITQVPGTHSLWAAGTDGSAATIWRYDPGQ